MLTDEAGFIYACTEQGVLWFDGRHFTSLGHAQGMPQGHAPYEIALTGSGRLAVRFPDALWIADTAATVGRPPSAIHFRSLPLVARPSMSAHDLAKWGGGLAVAVSNELRLVSAPESGSVAIKPLPLPPALRIPAGVELQGIFNLDNALWLLRTDGTACVWSAEPQCYGRSDGLPPERWLSAIEQADGTILIRSPTDAASLAPGASRWTVTKLPDQGRAYGNYTYLLDLFRTPDGLIATQADDGLAVLDGGEWQVLNERAGIPSGAITATTLDSSGSLWMQLPGQGIARRLAFGSWHTLTHANGLSTGAVWETARTQDGSVWVATDTGIDQLVKEGDQVLVRRVLPGAGYALTNSHGLLWGTNGIWGGLRVIDPGSGAQRSLPMSYIVASVQGDGDVTWVGTTKGIFRCEGSRLADIACRQVTAGLVKDLTGDGTGGLFYVRDKELRHLVADDVETSMLDHWPITDFDPAVMARQGDTIWVGGVGGLCLVTLHGTDAPTAAAIPASNIASNLVAALLVDHRGRLWASTDVGLTVFDGLRWTTANTEDGLLSDDLDQRGLREDPDGTIWITSSAGVSHLLRPDTVFAPHRLQVVISSAFFDGQLIRDADLPFSRKPMTINLGTPGYTAQKAVTFRYRLAGVDDDWVETNTTDILYPFVPPGRHKFEVFAYDPLKHRVSAPEALTIDMAYPWWRQWWAETLWTLAVVGIVYATFRLRVRAERARQAELERRVEEVTAEIRKAQAALAYQATHDQLTGLLNRSAVESRLAGFLRDAADIPEVVIGLVDVDHFKAINDGWGHLTGDSVLREMGALSAGILRSEEFAGRYGGEEILVVLRNADGRAVSRLAEFHQRVRTHSFSKAGTPGILTVTCSIGMAAVFAGDNWETLIGRADRALYHAKRSGRDRIAGLAGSATSHELGEPAQDRARSGDGPRP